MHLFEIGEDKKLSLVGKKGQVFYAAPMKIASDSKPLFAEFGADLEIPVSNFRDGQFNLDLLSVEGPGEVSVFQWRRGDYPRMLFSSTVAGLQSVWMSPGVHEHMYTTFTKPGLYKLTYRASARSTDGKFVASAPQVMRWQVGGARPEPGLGDVANAFATAKDTALPEPNPQLGDPEVTWVMMRANNHSQYPILGTARGRS
ncbi:MAG: choice-of-anchor M domain-containing protein [Actinomycetaceae bacterium]|nr:choice-of-anchor M domain-containing protein [Actinomycetaceae bacterium]